MEREMKVLVSAYACEPSSGSEPGAGWEWARAAAQCHDVWLLTRRNVAEVIERAHSREPSLRLHPVYVDLPAWILRAKRGRGGIFWYYPLWQLAAWREARRLQRDVGFDVIHHVTLAVDWMPAGVALLRGVPLVWGPVGGSTGTPLRLWRWLGPWGCLTELLREPATRLARWLFGRPIARRAALVIAQNHDVAREFQHIARVVTEPNTAIQDQVPPESQPAAADAGRPIRRRAVFVGRLIPWKGPRLAIAAMARPAAAGWSLDFYGDSRQRADLQRLARHLGVERHVAFKGECPRDQVLAAFSSADALLFPSMRDSAGWAVAEALSRGCPVVCLDRGGPAVLVGRGHGVKVPMNGAVAEDLARALRSLDGRIPPVSRWLAERLPAFLVTLYQDAHRGARHSVGTSSVNVPPH